MNRPRRPFDMWEVVRVPRENTAIPFRLSPAAQTLIVVNPLNSPIYIRFRRSPDPNPESFDVVCPERSILVTPVLSDRGTDTIDAAALLYTVQDNASFEGEDAPTEAMIYATDAAFPPSTGRVWGDVASESTLAAIELLIGRQPSGFSGGLTVAAFTVGVAAVELGSVLTRKKMVIQNRGAASIYLGPSTVTTASGLELATGEAIELDLSNTALTKLYGISGSAGNNVRVMELS